MPIFNTYPEINDLGSEDTLLTYQASSGRVKQIKKSKLKVASVAQTLALMKALTVSLIADGECIILLGYSSIGDGGGGVFRYDASSSATANLGTIFAPDVGAGRFLRVYDPGIVHARWFGVTANGTSDDSTSLQGAIDFLNTSGIPSGGTIILPKGTISIGTTTIKVNGVINIFGQGTTDSADNTGTRIKYTGSGTAIQVESENTGTTHGVNLRDFTVDGNNTGAVGMTVGRTTVSTISVKGIFSNIACRGFTEAGFKILAAEGCLFEFCKACFNKGHGMVLGVQTAGAGLFNTINTFLRCEFLTNGSLSVRSHGIVIYDGRSQVFSNCNFESNYGSGTRIEATGLLAVSNCVFNDCWWEGNLLGELGAGSFAQFDVTTVGGGSWISELFLNNPNFSTSTPSGGVGTYYDMWLQNTRAVIRHPTLSDNLANLVKVTGGSTSTYVTVYSTKNPYIIEPLSWNPVSSPGGTDPRVQYSLQASSDCIFEYFKETCGATTGSNLTEQRSAHFYASGGKLFRSHINRPTKKALTDNVAKDIGTLAGMDGATNAAVRAGGRVHYTIEATDGTEMQSHSGILSWAAVNKGGALTVTLTDLAGIQAQALTSGTLSVSWALSGNKVQVTANSSLAVSSMNISFQVINDSDFGMSPVFA